MPVKNMETEKLQNKMVKVLSYLVDFLEDSNESTYANESPKELLKIVTSNLKSVQSSGYLCTPELMIDMFLPTASLQEIAMDNGWGEQYIELSEHFELALDACH